MRSLGLDNGSSQALARVADPGCNASGYGAAVRPPRSRRAPGALRLQQQLQPVLGLAGERYEEGRRPACAVRCCRGPQRALGKAPVFAAAMFAMMGSYAATIEVSRGGAGLKVSIVTAAPSPSRTEPT